MRLLHEPADDADDRSSGADHDRRVLARTVDTAETVLSRARGLMFRRSIPTDYALVFRFDAVDYRDVHMVFVPFPIDALWLIDGEVVAQKRLRPWIGLGGAEADTLIELPAGATADVSVGDRIVLEDDGEEAITP